MVAPIKRYGPLDRFFRENGTDVYPVYGAIGRQGNPCDGQHGGENAGSYDRSPVDGGCRHLTWPTDDAGHTNTALVRGTLALAKSAGGTACAPIVAISLGTVVGSEDNESIIGFPKLVQGFHELAESVIDLRNVSVVLADAVVLELLVQFHELGIGLDRKMGFVGPDIEEEGFPGIAFLLQPADAFLHHQRCGIALQLSHFLPVAYEVARVAVVGRGVVRVAIQWSKPWASGCGWSLLLNLPLRCHFPTWQVS